MSERFEIARNPMLATVAIELIHGFGKSIKLTSCHTE